MLEKVVDIYRRFWATEKIRQGAESDLPPAGRQLNDIVS